MNQNRIIKYWQNSRNINSTRKCSWIWNSKITEKCFERIHIHKWKMWCFFPVHKTAGKFHCLEKIDNKFTFLGGHQPKKPTRWWQFKRWKYQAIIKITLIFLLAIRYCLKGGGEKNKRVKRLVVTNKNSCCVISVFTTKLNESYILRQTPRVSSKYSNENWHVQNDCVSSFVENAIKKYFQLFSG